MTDTYTHKKSNIRLQILWVIHIFILRLILQSSLSYQNPHPRFVQGNSVCQMENLQQELKRSNLKAKQIKLLVPTIYVLSIHCLTGSAIIMNFVIQSQATTQIIETTRK